MPFPTIIICIGYVTPSAENTADGKRYIALYFKHSLYCCKLSAGAFTAATSEPRDDVHVFDRIPASFRFFSCFLLLFFVDVNRPMIGNTVNKRKRGQKVCSKSPQRRFLQNCYICVLLREYT